MLTESGISPAMPGNRGQLGRTHLDVYASRVLDAIRGYDFDNSFREFAAQRVPRALA